MPSSVSLADPQRPPVWQWRKTWIWAGILTTLVLVLIATMQPVSDTFQRWAVVRHRASAAGDRGIVFIGTSRILASMRLDLVRRKWPGSIPLQLGVVGASPMPILDDIANDERVLGLVVVEYLPTFALPGTRDYLHEPMSMTARYHAFPTSLPDFSACWLGCLGPFVFGQNPDHSWVGLLRSAAIVGQPIDHYRYWYSSERELSMDFSGCKDSRKPPNPGIAAGPRVSRADLADLFQHMHADEARIQARGGRVVWVYLPFSGQRRIDEEATHPRAEFWDRYFTTNGSLGVHYLDQPALSALTCPDGAHLDQSESRTCTEALMTAISRTLFEAGDRRMEGWQTP